MKYPAVTSDAWIQPVKSGYRAMCCDCGLVHEFDFRIFRGRVQFRVRRNNRSTALTRRQRVRDLKETP